MSSSSCSYLLYRDPVPASFRAHFIIYQDAYIVKDLFYESSTIYKDTCPNMEHFQHKKKAIQFLVQPIYISIIEAFLLNLMTLMAQ